MKTQRSGVRLKDNWKAGENVSARWLNAVARLFNGLIVRNMKVGVNALGGLSLEAFGDGGGSAPFSGTVYLAGKKFTVSASATWVVVNFIAATVTTSTAGPSDPFPPGEEWYETSKVSGDIHVPRLGG